MGFMSLILQRIGRELEEMFTVGKEKADHAEVEDAQSTHREREHKVLSLPLSQGEPMFEDTVSGIFERNTYTEHIFDTFK